MLIERESRIGKNKRTNNYLFLGTFLLSPDITCTSHYQCTSHDQIYNPNLEMDLIIIAFYARKLQICFKRSTCLFCNFFQLCWCPLPSPKMVQRGQKANWNFFLNFFLSGITQTVLVKKMQIFGSKGQRYKFLWNSIS